MTISSRARNYERARFLNSVDLVLHTRTRLLHRYAETGPIEHIESIELRRSRISENTKELLRSVNFFGTPRTSLLLAVRSASFEWIGQSAGRFHSAKSDAGPEPNSSSL